MRKLYISFIATILLNIPYLLNAQSGIARSDINPLTHLPSFIEFKQDSLPSFNDAKKFYKSILPVQPNDELRLISKKTDEAGYTHLYFQQFYKGLRVEDGEYSIHIKNGKITTVNGNFNAVGNVNMQSRLTEKEALEKALSNINAKLYKWQVAEEEALLKKINGNNNDTYFPKGQLVVIRDYLESNSEYRLAYKFDVYAQLPLSRYMMYVDVINGKILQKENEIYDVNSPGTAATRYSGNQAITTDSYTGGFRLRETRGTHNVGIQTYNMHAGSNYGAATDYSDNNNNWTAAEFNNANHDNAALDAHWGTEKVFDYFSQIYTRNSWNNAGGALLGYVNTNLVPLGFNNSDNAFWDGARMTYGIGTNFQPFTSLDIIAHEIGHGICQSSIGGGQGIGNTGEAGALNEGLSDIWSACVKQWAAPAKPTWLLASEVVPGGLRSMSDPGALGQPDTYGGAHWQSVTGCTPNPQINDNCFVHNNDGVLNFWFFLLSQGGAGTNDLGNAYNITGVGINVAARIVYQAETNNLLTRNTNYAGARSAMITAATQVYGTNSCPVIAVTNAWYAVGVGAAFSAFAISGPAAFCSTASYSVTGTPTGSAIAWSTNPTGIINIPANGLTVTASKASSGSTTLTARVNGCLSLTKPVSTVPTITSISSSMNGTCRAGGYQDWSLTAYSNIAVTSWLWTNDNPNVYMYIYNPSGNGTMVTVKGGGGITVTAKDACNETFRNGVTIWAPCSAKPAFTVSPNPANNQIHVVMNNENKSLKGSGFKTIQIIDKMGLLKKQIDYNAPVNDATINVSSLKADVYVVKIFDGFQWINQQVIIKH